MYIGFADADTRVAFTATKLSFKSFLNSIILPFVLKSGSAMTFQFIKLFKLYCNMWDILNFLDWFDAG